MPENIDIQTVSHEQVKTSFTLPLDLLKAVKIEAINRGIDAQELYIAAIRQYLGLDRIEAKRMKRA